MFDHALPICDTDSPFAEMEVGFVGAVVKGAGGLKGRGVGTPALVWVEIWVEVRGGSFSASARACRDVWA